MRTPFSERAEGSRTLDEPLLYRAHAHERQVHAHVEQLYDNIPVEVSMYNRDNCPDTHKYPQSSLVEALT
jgi:hypothetical protein